MRLMMETPKTPIRRAAAGGLAVTVAGPTQIVPSTGLPTPNTPTRTASTPRSCSRATPTASSPQEPGSEEYLAKLLRISKRQTGAAPAMTDFLASSNFGSEAPAPSHSSGYASVEELQLQLREILDLKVTETRAEHVALTMELRSSVEFSLALTETDNEALEGLNNIDPSLGGVRSTSISVDPTGQTTRLVKASDALMNQSDNPVLQRTVAKHLIAALGTTDGSSWLLRDMSRVAQDWTFTYICKDSTQHWNRQNSKNPTTAVIGDYSQRNTDSVLMERPAFDCRGSSTITFSRSSRTIKIKYDHTPMHKTVAQLSAHYPRPERQFGPGYQIQQQKKTPKKSSTEKRKKKRASKAAEGNEDGEGGEEKPKKKRKKSSGKPRAKKSDGPAIPPDYPMDGQAGPSHNGAHASTNGEQTQDSSTNALPFNVTAEEAQRRIHLARQLLSDAGVDPDSLKQDQMHIFSNQSPELQRDSVAMLARYGAERLQIVHPANKDKPVSEASSQNAAPSTQATPTGNTTTKELLPSEKKGSRKRKSTAKALDADDSVVDETSQPAPKRKVKTKTKSRNACLKCKERRVKCPRQMPTCTECQTEGHACEYAPTKPKKRKSEAVVVEEEDDEDDEQEEEEAEQEAPQQQPSHQQPRHHTTHHDSVTYPQMPVANMLTPSVENNVSGMHSGQTSYFQSNSGLALPQPDTNHGPLALPRRPSDIAAPDGNTGSSMHHQQHAHIPRTSSPQNRRKTKTPVGNNRRSLPSGPPRGAETPMETTGNWMAINQTPVPVPQHGSVTSPTLAQQATARNQRSRQSNQHLAATSPPIRNSIPQTSNTAATAAAMSQARSQQQSPQLVAALQAHAQNRVVSPFQADQRTNSRQSQRNQSRTPNADQTAVNSRTFRPPGQQTMSDVRHTQSNDLVATTHYNNYNRYPGGASAGNDSSRIAYQPFSQQQQQTSAPETSSYPAYDYGRSSATALPMSQDTATAFENNSAPSSQFLPSASQTRSSQTYDKPRAYNNASGSYTPGSNTPSSSATLQNFDMRSSSQAKRPPPSAKQQNNSQYPSSHPPPQQQQNPAQDQQQMNQSQGWYGNFNNNSGSFPQGNTNSSYPYESWT